MDTGTSGRSFAIKSSCLMDDYWVGKTVLGNGLSGKVVECFDIISGEKFALKVMRDNERSRREVEMHWKTSSCEQIVSIKDVYENKYKGLKCILVVMEIMEGGELFARIMDKKIFNEKDAANIMKDIVKAVKFLHDMNMAHRDLKPENILFSKNSEKEILKLTDFGFAKQTSGVKTLMTPCYTPFYVAPEVLGTEKYDKSCDIWSLGVILYILLCGYPPFYSEHSEQGAVLSPGMKHRIRSGKYEFNDDEWENVSDGAKDLVKSCLNTNPEERLKIDEILQHPWISQISSIPSTPLCSPEVLRQEAHLWQEVEWGIEVALREMRVDRENIFIVKNPRFGDSNLAKRRLARDKECANI